jgi:hypothetical protein
VGKSAVTIEVHGHVVRLDGPLAFDIQDFWERARPLNGGAAAGYALSPEDQVLHLSLNFFRDRRFHSRGAIGQLCDVSESVAQAALDWDAIVERGRRYRIGGPLACTLALARMLLDAPVPEGVLSSLAPALSERNVAAFARLRVVTSRSWVTTELVKPQEPYGHMGLVRAILRRIVPTREYMRLHYGEAGFGTYWRRFGRAARMLAGFVQRPSELTDDLTVDRWVHSLYEQSGRRRPIPERRT